MTPGCLRKRTVIRIMGVIGMTSTLLAMGLMSGCAAKSRGNPGFSGTPGLFFGGDRSAQLATRIGRSRWPATYGRVESVEATYFVEYYRDYQGSATQERTNPYRFFRSYRVGTRYR